MNNMAAKKTLPFEIYSTNNLTSTFSDTEIDLRAYMDLADNQVFAIEDVWVGVDTTETTALASLGYRAQLTDLQQSDMVSHSEPTSIAMSVFDGSVGYNFEHSALEDAPQPRYNVSGKLYLGGERIGSNNVAIVTRITGQIVTLSTKDYAQLVLTTNKLTA